jgi:hypothetical protein
MTDFTTPPDFRAKASSDALWNTYLRDNMTHVKNPPTVSYSYTYAASNYKSTASTSWAAMGTVLSLSLETFGGDVMLNFIASCEGVGYLDFAIDSQRQGGNDGIVAFTSATAFGISTRMFWVKQELVAGTHSFDVYWKAASGTIALKQYVPPQFVVREFS